MGGNVFEIVDLTRRLSDRTLQFPGDERGLVMQRVDLGVPNVQLTHIAHLDLHLGTHIDAPLHFIPGGADVAGLGLALRPAVVVRTREREVPPSALPVVSLRDCAVLFDTGWTIDAESRAYFEGFPYLSLETAAELVDRGAAVVGIDSPSVDPADSVMKCAAHRALLSAGIPIVEGLCNLDRIPREVGPLWFAAFPLKIDGAEGSPVRAAILFAPPNKPHRRDRRSGWTK
ncbi:MAG: cyclase family protein [Candidatus Bipolaricaulis sp.]|nr:cyclase family protein [Candidatus Bipolaricaulis sp.]